MVVLAGTNDRWLHDGRRRAWFGLMATVVCFACRPLTVCVGLGALWHFHGVLWRRRQFTRMWQSIISLRYVSYKNAGSNLHKRIGAMAMMAKNLLWSCGQIIVPRPPINPQRPNHAMERTADRCAFTFEMTSTLS